MSHYVLPNLIFQCVIVNHMSLDVHVMNGQRRDKAVIKTGRASYDEGDPLRSQQVMIATMRQRSHLRPV